MGGKKNQRRMRMTGAICENAAGVVGHLSASLFACAAALRRRAKRSASLAHAGSRIFSRATVGACVGNRNNIRRRQRLRRTSYAAAQKKLLRNKYPAARAFLRCGHGDSLPVAHGEKVFQLGQRAMASAASKMRGSGLETPSSPDAAIASRNGSSPHAASRCATPGNWFAMIPSR